MTEERAASAAELQAVAGAIDAATQRTRDAFESELDYACVECGASWGDVRESIMI